MFGFFVMIGHDGQWVWYFGLMGHECEGDDGFARILFGLVW